MKYNFIPKTNLLVSELSLGAMTFGGQTDEADSMSIMDYAFEHGINVLDTANAYNQGKSEEIAGKWVKNHREKVILATKVGNEVVPGDGSGGLGRRTIRMQFDASRKRLDTDYIDIYYLHQPDYHTCLEETLDTMNELVHKGLVHYIGVSNYAAWQIADILAICEKYDYVRPIMTQNVYNLITRGIEAELLPFLKTHQVGMTAYNPLAAGMLAGKHKPGKPAEGTRFALQSAYYDRYWSDENFTAIEKLKEIAENLHITPLQLAMKWVSQQPSVTTTLTGVSRLTQLEQNIASVEIDPFDEETLDACEAVWKSLAGTRFAYNR
ncbi:aldo/keto reductase [Luxibacter massiliensis]|uniref:aldo/keto reductase n=1 Tax=Luxibacter massiliensis TaxID=2219695 RepID=UPI000F06EAED|nr:aldo/keto reductase [Luxibacter massiliensis]